jgi:hypothetical protein
LLEDAWSVVRFVKSQSPAVSGISSLARVEIMKLEPLLEAERKADLLAGRNWKALMGLPLWSQLRDQAATCLQALEFDLDEWEATLGDG